MDEIDDRAGSGFEAVAYRTWLEKVAPGASSLAATNLMRSTPGGRPFEPLVTPDHPGAVPGAALRASAGWSIWVRERVADGRWPEGVEGLWLDGAELVDDARLAEQVAEGGRSVGLEAVDRRSQLVELARWYKDHGLGPDAVRGVLGVDPLGRAAAGGHELSLDPSVVDYLDLWPRLFDDLPSWTVVRPSSRPYHDAGADEVLELALCVAAGLDYLRWFDQRGVALERVFGQSALALPVDRHLPVQIAKLRAARRLWRHVAEACGVEAAVTVHAETSWRSKTAADPHSNLLRSTGEAMAGALGGADLVTTGRFDRALAERTELGAHLAATLQAVLRDEAHLGRIADPAAGSWSIERLTEELVDAAWERVQTIEAEGGLERCLASGAVREWVEAAATSRREAIAAGRLPIVGTTVFSASDARSTGVAAPESPGSRWLPPPARDSASFEADAPVESAS